MTSLSFLKNTKSWVILGVLLALCFLTYNNSLHNPFMIDDHTILTDVKLKNIKFLLNSFIYPSSSTSQGETFNNSGEYYRPMAYVISMLSYQAFGNEPYGYHVLNLCLFTLMCFTLYVFIDVFFKDRALAVVTSILFAVHPINVLFVNYNTSGIQSVRFILMFLSAIFFLKAAGGVQKSLSYSISLICFAIALLCHETSMVLPFYILFLSILVSKDGFKGAVFGTWPYFLMLLSYLLFRVLVIGMPAAHPQPFLPEIGAFSKLIYLYLSKLLFPDFIPLGWNVLLTGKYHIVWIAGLFILLLGWYRTYRAGVKSMPFFCATWLMLGFLPVTAACMSRPSFGLIIEPHWLTFSSVGFFLFISWAGLKFFEGRHKLTAGLLYVFLLANFISISRYNNWIWGNEIRYYDYWKANIEGYHSHGNDFEMGNIYLTRKDYHLARYYFEKVAKSGLPEFKAPVYSNLGLIEVYQGHIEQAKKDFLTSINSDPDSISALNNLAMIYISQSDYKKARSLLSHALELDKYSIESRLNLAYILEKEGDLQGAIGEYKVNLNTVPYEARSLLALIRIDVQLKDVNGVLDHSSQLITHCQDPAVLTELGSFLAQSGQLPVAYDAFDHAIRIDPLYKQAYLEAGKLLANVQRYDEAIRVWKMGERIDPRDREFEDNIQKAMKLRSDRS